MVNWLGVLQENVMLLLLYFVVGVFLGILFLIVIVMLISRFETEPVEEPSPPKEVSYDEKEVASIKSWLQSLTQDRYKYGVLYREFLSLRGKGIHRTKQGFRIILDDLIQKEIFLSVSDYLVLSDRWENRLDNVDG